MTGDDPAELVALTGMECYRLLAGQQVGRLGVDVGRYPLIFPVNFVLDGETILVRTHPGTMLASSDFADVTFEVDEIDPRTHSGWSVLVRGIAEEVPAPPGGGSPGGPRTRGPEPWAPGEHGRWLRITPRGISGRRIEVARPAQPR